MSVSWIQHFILIIMFLQKLDQSPSATPNSSAAPAHSVMCLCHYIPQCLTLTIVPARSSPVTSPLSPLWSEPQQKVTDYQSYGKRYKVLKSQTVINNDNKISWITAWVILQTIFSRRYRTNKMKQSRHTRTKNRLSTVMLWTLSWQKKTQHNISYFFYQKF